MAQSKNFEKVKKYYDTGKWTVEMVKNAVTNPKSGPWITKTEFKKITGQAYSAT